MAKKIVKPTEYSYVLKYVPGILVQQLIGGLVANPHYSQVKEQNTGMSVSDWEPARQNKLDFPAHYNTLARLMREDEWVTPVSIAAFPAPAGNEPLLYLLSGAPIALISKEMERPLVAVVACHGGVYQDEEDVSKPETALPKGATHWYDAAGWRYASAIASLVIPERPVQLFV